MVGCGIYIYATRHSLALKANSNSLPGEPGPSHSPPVPDSPLQAAVTRGLVGKGRGCSLGDSDSTDRWHGGYPVVRPGGPGSKTIPHHTEAN